MASPTDDFLDAVQTAVEGYLAGESPPVAAPLWLRDSGEAASDTELDAITHRIYFARKTVSWEPTQRVGGNARGRLGRRTHLVAEIRGDDFADAEALHDALAWALREVGGTAHTLGSGTWLPTLVGSRGVALSVPFSMSFEITDNPTDTATVESTTQSAALVPSLP